MGRVITKLNLNKTPQLVENNSLIFAKNIKLLKDLILKSSNKNRAFIHYVKNPYDGDKINIILGIDKGLLIG